MCDPINLIQNLEVEKERLIFINENILETILNSDTQNLPGS
jgi:hypothetical protein